MEKAKRKIPFWMRAAVSVVAAAIVLVIVGVGLRYWITSDGGRAFIVSQIDGRKIAHQEILFQGFGRVRDVQTGPDGNLYALLQNQNGDPTGGSIIRLVPAQ